MTENTLTVAAPQQPAADNPGPQRERNPRGEGDRLRTELLDAAVELMAEKGDLDAISLRAIAARAGVSPTAVYRHFDDHHALLQAAVVHCWHEFDAALEDAPAEDDDPYEAMTRAGVAYVDFAMTHPGKYHVLFSNKLELGEDGHSAGTATFDKLVDKVARILERNGDDRDPFFVACEVHTWIHGIVDLVGRHPDFDWPPIESLLEDLRVRLGLTRPTQYRIGLDRESQRGGTTTDA